MNKFIRYSSIKPGYEMLHDGRLHVVERVDDDSPLYTTIVLPTTVVQRPFDYLAGVRIPPKPRSRPACPPLTARLTPEDRAWVLEFSAAHGCSPQELLALALQDYRAAKEAPVPLPAPAGRRWWWRKRAA